MRPAVPPPPGRVSHRVRTFVSRPWASNLGALRALWVENETPLLSFEREFQWPGSRKDEDSYRGLPTAWDERLAALS